MFRASTSGICLILLIITSGCGKKDGIVQISAGVNKPPDQAKVARIQALNDDFVSALNSCTVKISQVVDKNSAMSAAEELTKSAKRFREIAKELRSVGKLTKGEEAQLSAKSAQTASANFGKATKGLTARLQEGTLPPEAIRALRDGLLDFSKASMEFSEASRAMEP